MSAPTPAPGDDRPREGYYPDPSIPGYVRYWNGAAWVPGTSRPAPAAGETLPRPPGVEPAPSANETGPVFFDEGPQPDASIPQQASGAQDHPGIPEQPGPDQADRPPSATPAAGIPEQAPPAAARASDPGPDEFPSDSDGPARDDADRRPAERDPRTDGGQGGTPDAGDGRRRGGRPEPASAWGADSSRQSGFGGDRDRRVSWGAPQGADPRVAHPEWPAAEAGAGPGVADGTLPIRAADQGSVSSQGSARTAPSEERASGVAHHSESNDGTFTFRRPGAGKGPEASGPSEAPPEHPAGESGTVAIRAVRPGAGPQLPAGPPAPPGPQVPPQSGEFGGPQGPQTASPPPGNPRTMPYFPQQPGGRPAAQPAQPAPQWAPEAQAARGAGDEPVVPWKPPVNDPFLAAAQAQAAARPAPLGKRFAARLLDTVVVLAVTAAAAVPLGGKAVDHVNDKIDAAKLSGETVTVWLLDGTTGTCLGAVLAVLLVFGVLYEALPTAKWGRTLGKRLCGIEVRDIEAHEAPGFGAALRRWFVFSVPGLLVIGVLGVLWCLFDRPWRQCWHDKAAHTFVAS